MIKVDYTKTEKYERYMNIIPMTIIQLNYMREKIYDKPQSMRSWRGLSLPAGRYEY